MEVQQPKCFTHNMQGQGMSVLHGGAESFPGIGMHVHGTGGS